MQDLSNYTADYYRRAGPDAWFALHGLLRPDQLAALCYTTGMAFTGFESYDGLRMRFRDPGTIMSVGAGTGMLEHQLEEMGYEVIGVDPSQGAKELYAGSVLQDGTDGIEDCGTVIFCSSLEHIPLRRIREMWSEISTEHGTRVIVVNWVSYLPLDLSDDDWDHITRLDDDLYDELSEGFRTVVRWGSHLVLERRK